MKVLDLEFDGLVEYAELVVELDDFAVLVEFLLDLAVKRCHERAEQSYGVIIGF